jgi:hypothetical protein
VSARVHRDGTAVADALIVLTTASRNGTQQIHQSTTHQTGQIASPDTGATLATGCPHHSIRLVRPLLLHAVGWPLCVM